MAGEENRLPEKRAAPITFLATCLLIATILAVLSITTSGPRLPFDSCNPSLCGCTDAMVLPPPTTSINSKNLSNAYWPPAMQLPNHTSIDESELINVRLVSYNIRFATEKPVAGEKPWDVRRSRLVSQLRFIASDHGGAFFCLQEALHRQVLDIQNSLGDGWSHIGRGRGKRTHDGEYSPIFYRSDTWALERTETRWLSKTPNEPSVGWDARFERIVTMGEFSHKVNGTRVVVMSTHFDHVGKKAREHSAELLIDFASEWSSKGSDGTAPSAVLIGGDFNSEPSDNAYKTMVAPDSGMSDIADLVPEQYRYGNKMTYTSFGEPGERPMLIDFLFIKEPRTAVVTSYGVLSNCFDDGIRISDHNPLVADIKIVR